LIVLSAIIYLRNSIKKAIQDSKIELN